jgi:adenosylhomocysteine nucleosidase
MTSSPAERLAPAPVPADVGIVIAMAIEAGYLFDSLKRVRRYSARGFTITEGELCSKLLAVILTGPGKAAARRGTELLIAGHRPRWLISAGFAGALDPALVRNDLVVPGEVADLAGEIIALDCSIPTVPPSVRVGGRLLSVDRVITRAAEKAELRRVRDADLIDMETSAVALLARERSLRFLALRIISDDATVELPSEVANLLSHSGSYRLGMALRAIWRRPQVIQDFWTLHAQALEASDRLALCLKRLLEVLPPA